MLIRFQMHSPLSRHEIVAALGSQIDGPWQLFGSKPVVGSVSRSRLWLRMRKNYRSSFQTLLTARLSDSERGTLLRCHTGMSRFVIAFFVVWFGGGLSFSGAFVFEAIKDGAFQLATALPFAMLLFGIGLVAFGRWLARDERDALVAFLQETIDASLSG